MVKSIHQNKTELEERFMKLVASHLVREADLLVNKSLSIQGDILLRNDSELTEELRAQVKEGLVVEDDIIFMTDRRGTTAILPVTHLVGGAGERSLLLCAIFGAGSKIPKAGRLRANFDKEGNILALSFTDARNRAIAPVKFDIGQTITPAGHARRTMLVYLDGFCIGAFVEVERGYWVYSPGGPYWFM
jgi:hypothetical protein